MTLAVLARAGAAQAVRGEVVDSAEAQPVHGVLVELVRLSGETVARTITSSVGAFVLEAPAPGRYRVRALRIGFRPSLSEVVDVPAEGRAGLRVTLGTAPVALAAIRVRARSACRPLGAGEQDAAMVWEEARKALALAAVTTNARQHRIAVVTYERDLDGSVVAFEESRHAETTEPRAFRSVSLDTLLRNGFVVERNGSLVFHGPDADVLLADPFLASHCLRLVASPDGDTNNVAIAFEPTGQRDLIDVRGTLTLARATGELQRLDFSYVGLPDEARAAGGTLEFAALDDGGWVVRRWALRIPVLDVEEGVAPTASGVGRADRVSVRAMRVVGGEVTSVAADGAELLRIPLRVLTGRVLTPDGRSGVAHARVWLAGTTHETTTGDDGTFALDELLPARYRLLAATSLLDSLGGVAPGGVVDLTSGDVSDGHITLGDPESVYRALCGVETDDRKGALLRVTVRHSATRATIPGATVTLRWGGIERDARILGKQQERVLHTEPNGSVAYCGTPRNIPIRVRVTVGSVMSAEQEFVIRPLRPFHALEVPIVPR